MGKNLKGKECGKGICQRKDGKYAARYTARMVHARKSILTRFRKPATGLPMRSTKISTMFITLPPK